jgi:hypothetical protein
MGQRQMTDFWVERMAGALRPLDYESLEELNKLPVGRPLHVEVKQPRNAAHSRLYWALCHRIADARGVTAENISDVLKIATGHFNLVRTKSYGDIHVPKSISFAKMDQTEFRTFFERCVLVVYEEWKIEPELVNDLLVPSERA